MEKISVRRLALPLAAVLATVLAAVVARSHVVARPGRAAISGRVTASQARYRTDAVVYVDGIGGTFVPPTQPAMLDQRRMQFVPRVLPVVKGTTVRFVNDDTTSHGIYSPEAFYEFNLPAGQHADHVFAHRGVFMQLCHMHPAIMVGYVVVLPNPYFALVRADGSFRIPDVPAGDYQLKAWQEHARGAAASISVPSSGGIDVTIPLHRAAW